MCQCTSRCVPWPHPTLQLRMDYGGTASSSCLPDFPVLMDCVPSKHKPTPTNFHQALCHGNKKSSIYFSCRGCGFNGSSQLSTIPIPRKIKPSPRSKGTRHAHCTHIYIHVGKPLIHTRASCQQLITKQIARRGDAHL